GSSGEPLGTIDVGATAAQATTHPDWSPDGSRIVYTRTGKVYDGGANNQRFYRAAIQMVEDRGGGAWQGPIDLVASQAGVNNYYPSFAPDSQLIAFNRSTCPTGDSHKDCNGDSDPTASIYSDEAGAGRAGHPAHQGERARTDRRRLGAHQLLAALGAVRVPAHRRSGYPPGVDHLLVDPALRPALAAVWQQRRVRLGQPAVDGGGRPRAHRRRRGPQLSSVLPAVPGS